MPELRGARLKRESLAVTFGGLSIAEVQAKPAIEARRFFEEVKIDPALAPIAGPLIAEVVRRLDFLGRVGLDYLQIDRPSDTLSGGELQRVRLASQIGSGLVGVCYVLDEPTSGLHPVDTDRLIASLVLLRDAGNSVLVVEHDERVIRAADWVLDLGPGAGPDGGTLVAEGPPSSIASTADSPTARMLARPPDRPNGRGERLERSPGRIEVIEASEHNLRGIDADFPLGCLTTVTGVSGSGKSSLVLDVLGRAIRRRLGLRGPRPGRFAAIRGLEAVASIVEIDQSPIGRSPRSTPATFVGVFDEIRRLYARTKEAKVRGYGPGRFSFNARGGRCETCLGLGSRKVEMQFLPDLFVRCESCQGLRYNRPTLEVLYRGLSIGEALNLRVDEALARFDAIPKIARGLRSLKEAGLGYVTLGQSSTTLSGGEAQRVKLAAGLNRAEMAGSLYVLDEPTTGLHPADVANLIRVMTGLADLGGTLVVIEHNLDVVRASDWVIDLGPGRGPTADGSSREARPRRSPARRRA